MAVERAGPRGELMIKRVVGGSRDRRFRVLVGAVLLGGFVIQCERALREREDDAAPMVVQAPVKAGATVAFASLSREQPRAALTLEERAAQDPVRFFEELIEQYDRTVRDYTCTFAKRERLGGTLTAQQVMASMFREKPFSVRLKWTQNADKCDRVLYVADRWTEDGQQMAAVEPGWLARLVVSHVMRPIHGPEAQKSSRRTIDQFGLRNALVLALKYVKLAREKDVASDFAYQGTSEVQGRETLVFERRLPYAANDEVWPDRVLVIHIDRELMVPTLCSCYADDEKTQLLGEYMTTDIKLNVNLPDSVFTKAGMGL